MNEISSSRAEPVRRACDLAPEIDRSADEIERTRRLSAALLDSLFAARLFRMLLPRSFDGDEVRPEAYILADYAYKAAGVDAIFPGRPFERRFRDIHTLSQQIQSRDAHYEAIGQVLLGAPPEVFF